MIKTSRKVRCIEDLDYKIIDTNREILVFVDRVLYAKRKNAEEAWQVLRKVYETRRCI